MERGGRGGRGGGGRGEGRGGGGGREGRGRGGRGRGEPAYGEGRGRGGRGRGGGGYDEGGRGGGGYDGGRGYGGGGGYDGGRGYGGGGRGYDEGGRGRGGRGRSGGGYEGGHGGPLPPAAPPPPLATEAAAQRALSARLGAITLAEKSRAGASRVLRPDYGKVGERRVLVANHFPVTVSKREIHHYDVVISPDVSRGTNRIVIAQLQEHHRVSDFGGRRGAYDGRKILCFAGPLPFQEKDFTVVLRDADREQPRERVFKVRMKLVNQINLDRLENLYLTQYELAQECIQMLDIVMREAVATRNIPVGRSYFKEAGSQPLGGGVMVYKGFYQSIRPADLDPARPGRGTLSLIVDMSATGFYCAMPVVQFVQQFFGQRAIYEGLSDSMRIKLQKLLKTVRVEVTHRGGPNKPRYRIGGLTRQPTAELRFTLNDERGAREITVQHYFKQTYNKDLQFLRLPCLEVGPRKNFLPMECCTIVAGQPYRRKLSDNQTREMITHTSIEPFRRQGTICEFVSANAYDQSEMCVEFGISVGKSMQSVNGRILPPPKLLFGERSRSREMIPQRGAWNLMNQTLCEPATVTLWGCLCLESLPDDMVTQFLKKLASECQKYGMKFHQQWSSFKRANAVPGQFERKLYEVNEELKALKIRNRVADNVMILCILPDNNNIYSLLKRYADTSLHVVTQCVLAKNVGPAKLPYLANVVLKINMKAGGTNFMLSQPPATLTSVPTIVIGADVTHPAPGEDMAPSIAAVVGSMDWPASTKYHCVMATQEHRCEIIQDLFKVDERTGHPMGMIRDGVSEGQFMAVMRKEITEIKKACKSLDANYEPSITFIVVQKRHHTRLFDQGRNVDPGTVVDQGICHPTDFDFYLCSHAGIKGTSRPAHYTVLYDENNLGSDALQTLTNNLCYTYAACTRSVSVVPPAYYAHLAAFRARFYLGDVSDESSASEVGEGAVGRQRVITPLPELSDSIRKVMFYC
ncbi:hypothetical protein CBR_g3051 [Chara braunii]|uniref:Piwi domain-containing protein n=1 Tax=Chara braunii TaxID=69332 RepID=A0A388KES6_CHABU|nr:hypothetical protein CBR_g3051 [Chara braunii]|eukprot:GBG68507.1 hypothetical protein CBR_g3051 [Chara braunii]